MLCPLLSSDSLSRNCDCQACTADSGRAETQTAVRAQKQLHWTAGPNKQRAPWPQTANSIRDPDSSNSPSRESLPWPDPTVLYWEWHQMSLWLVGVSCPECVPSQFLVKVKSITAKPAQFPYLQIAFWVGWGSSPAIQAFVRQIPIERTYKWISYDFGH